MRRGGSSLRHEGSFVVARGLFGAVHGFLSSCSGVGFLFSSCGMQAPEHLGSVVCSKQALSLRRSSSVVLGRGLSCPMACGILVPRTGIEPVSPALEGGFFTTGPPGMSQ